jgi:hypothetical protein
MADTPIGDPLNEIFDQFDPEAQARINKAEKTSREVLAKGAAAVADRLLAVGSPDRTEWAVQPENDARADAARCVFGAYVNELWRQTDGPRPECVQSFLAKVEQLIEPILARYGLAGGELLDDLLYLCRSNIQLATQRSTAAEASGATEEGKIVEDQTVAPDEIATFLRDNGILQFHEPWRVRQKRYADLNALYARRHTRNGPEVAGQEELLQDARAWARAEIWQSVSQVQNVFELKDRIARKTWDDFVPKHRHYSDFKLGYQELVDALWEEGSPSLEDHAIVAVADRARSATKAPPLVDDQVRHGGEPIRADVPAILENPFPKSDARHLILAPYIELIKKFGLLAEEYPSLSVIWRAGSGFWLVWPPPRRAVSREGIPYTQGGDLVVEEAATEAAERILGLGRNGAAEGRTSSLNPARDRWLNHDRLQPSEVWLHAIREFWLTAIEEAQASGADLDAIQKMAERYGFLPGQSTAIGRRVWALMVTRHKSLEQITKEQGLLFGQELDGHEEPAGWIHAGKITYAFKAFAHFCGVLAARRVRELETSLTKEKGARIADLRAVAGALAAERGNDMRQGLEEEISALSNEVLSIHKRDGQIFESVRARVSLPRVFIADVRLPIKTGDKVIRPLPNGLKYEFIVDASAYHPEFGGVAAYFEVTVHPVAAVTETAADARQPNSRQTVKRPPVSRVPRPPSLVSGISAPERPTVTIPRIVIDYPEDFSELARGRVFLEQVHAEEELQQERDSIRSTEDQERALLKFVMRLFAAFAKEACDLVQQGTWAAERCNSECHDVLLQYARASLLTREGGISHELQSKIEGTLEWKHYRQRLREVAHSALALAELRTPAVDQQTNSAMKTGPRATLPQPSPLEALETEQRVQKGNLKLLQKTDGSRYESVDFPTAEKYADITPRRRQQLIREGVFEFTGKGKNRRITVKSLIAYCPLAEDAK